MPVESFLMGAEGWTPIGHKATRDDPRMLPIGPIHAAEAQDATSVCGGIPVELDREGRTFTPWGAGTCERCSETLAPRAAPTPPDAHSHATRGSTMTGPEETNTPPDAPERAVAESDTVEEAAARAAEGADVERPLGAARPERTGTDGEPLGGEGS